MFTRKDYENLFGIVSDAEWAYIQKSIDDAIDRMYEDDHPLDD